MLHSQVTRELGLIAIICLVALGGCAKVPIKELEAYRSAFAQVSLVGGELYQQAATVVADVEAAQRARAKRGDAVQASLLNPPTKFDPHTVVDAKVSLRELPPAVAVRISALATVVAYNEALVAHVSGDPLEKVVRPLKSAVGEIQNFAGLLNTFPGAETLGIANVTAGVGSLLVKLNPFQTIAPGVLAAVQTLARLGLKAKAEEETRKALLEGYDSVVQVLTVLEADTEQLYGFQQVRCGLVIFQATDAAGLQALDPIDGLTAAFERPTRNDAALKVKALEERMTAGVIATFQPSTFYDPCGSGDPQMITAEDLKGQFWDFPYRFEFAKEGGRSMDKNSLKALEAFVARYEQHAARTVSAREALQRYHDQTLQDYVMLLRHSKQGLATVWNSAQRSLTSAELAGELMEVGARIRVGVDRMTFGNEPAAPAISR